MGNRNYSSTVTERTLSAAMSSSTAGNTTSMQLNSTSAVPSFPFTMVIAPDTTAEEIVTVTGFDTPANTFLVTRGQEGTSAVAHGTTTDSVSTKVRHMITARDLQETQDHVTATSNIHGITGALAPAASPTFTGLATFSGTVSLPTSSVTNSNLASSAVTSDKIASGAGITPSQTTMYDATNYVNQLSVTDGTTRRPIPFAMAAGTKLVTSAGIASGVYSSNITVTFDTSTRFTDPPIVTLTATGGVGGTPYAVPRVSSTSTTGFVMTIINTSSATISFTNFPINWTAVQMKSSSASNS
jgi:hypothetical protein